MKTFNSIEELKPYLNEETNTYFFNDDVTFKFDLVVDGNINSFNINARDINARDINARDIIAWNIAAQNISYYAFCIVYKNFVCESVLGRHDDSIHTCIDGGIVRGVKYEK